MACFNGEESKPGGFSARTLHQLKSGAGSGWALHCTAKPEQTKKLIAMNSKVSFRSALPSACLSGSAFSLLRGMRWFAGPVAAASVTAAFKRFPGLATRTVCP
jgi:hypothetical protein